jgi:hypothetical protein
MMAVWNVGRGSVLGHKAECSGLFPHIFGHREPYTADPQILFYVR